MVATIQSTLRVKSYPDLDFQVYRGIRKEHFQVKQGTYKSHFQVKGHM